MKPTEHPAKTPSPATGIFATLCAYLPFQGTRAPSFARTVVALLAVPAAVLITATPAFAASLETPETGKAELVAATTATLHGVVNPGGLGLAGGWQFHYAPSETECTGGGLAPGLPELTLGAKEAVEESVTGLQPAKKYTFCLVASDLSGESASGALVPFETLPAPPALTTGSEKASSVTATGASLEATLNPNNEETTYTFEYSEEEKAGKLEGAIVKVPSAAGILTAEFGEPTVSVPTEVLKPSTTYFYRVVAENAQSKIESKPVEGPVASFTSAPEAPTTSTPAKSVTATTAVLEGVLNPKAEAKAGWYFAYSTGGTCTGSLTSAQEPEATVKNQTESKEVTGLEPSQKYTFCLVAANAAGTQATAGNEETLETKPAPPETGSESKSGESPYEATLEAQVNPDNQTTTYSFEYSTSNTLAGAITLKGESPLSGYGDRTASVSTGHHLAPGTTYYFRVVATNPSGTTTDPTIEEFKTPAAVAPVIESETSSAITPEGATLEATIDPEYQETTCKFEYGTNASLPAGEETTTKPCLSALGEGGSGVATSLAVTGLKLETTYHFRVDATNATGETKDTTIGEFTTENTVAPTLSGEATANQTTMTADLTAEINPNGAEATYVMEYGTTTAYGASTPAAKVPGGRAAVPVTQHIEQLKPNTEYHWRLTATNAAGTATSPDHVFTYPTTAPELPDHRAYEMLTPVKKNGGLIGASFIGLPPVISEGPEAESLHRAPSRVIASTIQCFAPSESCTGGADGAAEGEPFQFTRTDEAGQCEPQQPPCWATTALAPPATRFSESNTWLYSADEGTSLFSMPTGPQKEEEWYARSSEGSFTSIGPAGPPGYTKVAAFQLRPTQSTADLSHVVWENNDEAAQPWPFDKTVSAPSSNGVSLYEYSGAHNSAPLLVGVTGGEGSDELISTCGTRLPRTISTPWNGLSADGRTVFFTVGQKEAREQNNVPCPGGGTGTNAGKAVPVGELYARIDGEDHEPGAAHTVAISEPQALDPAALNMNCESPACKANTSSADEEAALHAGEEGAWRGAAFQGASENGSRVFFTSRQQLTDQAAQSPGTGSGGGRPTPEGCSEGGGDCNLYLYDSALPEGRRLIDVSEGSRGPRVQAVLATSADGSHVYFIAQGVLTTAPSPSAAGRGRHGEPVTSGAVAQDGEDNLYVFDTETHHTAFVASLPASDYENDWEFGRHLANVTPDGRFLVFQSHGELTQGDTRGERYAQIFRYDAEGERLVRVSSGEAGFNDNGNAGVGDATIVRAFDGALQAGPARGDPTMSNDGAYVFFQSPIALTPHALNDVVVGKYYEREYLPIYAQNVYEYHAGHVYLISDGRDTSTAVSDCGQRVHPQASAELFESATCLLGTDATGHNVFFSTADRLVPADTDTQVDIYDARVCEPASGNPCIQPAPAPSPPCLGEQCHGIPPARSSLLTGGSETFDGGGNLTPPPPPPAVKKTAAQIRAEKLTKALKACKKDKKKAKRKSCEKQARKRFGPAKKAKKSTHHKGSH